VSAARPSRRREHNLAGAPAPRDMSALRARRADAERRRRLFRVDLALGALIALVLLLATPGVAIAAIFAALLLVACGVSILLQRRRRRRR
jgi:Flp pilus assembly protein TadB